ncbi:MAG: RES family NAD+ phosphorylase [Gemmatimonas sp.]|nr:RES family NAD+ phosphorylase [Gemmatimonas sp.]
MIVWRLTRGPYAALDGEGARRGGGRWNSVGTALVYASHALSLAALEYLVHIDPDDAPADLVGIALEIPDTPALTERWELATLPRDWRALSIPAACQTRGDAWVAGQSALAVWVPSVVIPGEANLLINPVHAAMADIRVLEIAPFAFDPRLLYRADAPAAR